MNTERKQGRGLTVRYTSIQALYNMSYCCVTAFASVFLLYRGLSNSQVGIVLTVGNGLTILCQPILASFADRTRKMSLRALVALLIAVTSFFTLLLILLPASVLPTMLLYIALCCFFGLYPPLITSMAMEHIDRGASLNFSLARGFGSLGFALLSLLMGFLTDGVGPWVVLPVSLAISLGNILLVSRFPQPEGSAGKEEKQEAVSFWEFARRNRRFLLTTFSVVLLLFSHVLINTYTYQIVENVGGTRSDMGIAAALGGFLELPAMALFPFLLKKLKSAGVILKLSAVFFVLKTVLTLLAPSMGVLYAAQCLQFFAFALYVPSSVYYASRVVSPADKVKGQSTMGLANTISGLLGNAIGGFLLDAGGVSLMLTVGLAISVVGLILLLVSTPRDRTEPAAGEARS